jgi:hypothetical protein
MTSAIVPKSPKKTANSSEELAAAYPRNLGRKLRNIPRIIAIDTYQIVPFTILVPSVFDIGDWGY